MIVRLSKALLAVNNLTANLAAATLLSITALLLIDVILRAVYQPILGSQEIAEMAMVVILFGALSLIEAKAKQIRVDLLVPMLGPQACAWIDRISYTLAALLWAALGWSMWQIAGLSVLLNMSSNLIGLQRAPFQYFLVTMAALAAVTCAAKIFSPSNQGNDHA